MTRVTIHDVAKLAGVSAMTVSRVVNNKDDIRPETRARVQKAIDTLGYRPSKIARSLITQQTHTLGLVIPDITNPFFPEIVSGAEDAASQAGYSLMLFNTNENAEREQKALHMLEDASADGVIICSSRLPTNTLELLLRRHSAVVLVNRTTPDGLASSVRVDDALGSMRAVHHLRSGGRNTIGFLSGPQHSHSAKERHKGFVTALEMTGHEADERLIEPCFPNEAGGYDAALRLLARTPALDALVCYNDLVAIGALRALTEKNKRVPDDVALIGCDDIRMASLTQPTLTTLGINKHALGASSVNMLIQQIEHKQKPDALTLKPDLIIRQSAP